MYESRFSQIPRNSKSQDLARIMIDNVNNLDDLLAKIKDKTFAVSYFDKYNQSEFSMRLMLQFVDQIKEDLFHKN